MLPLLVNLAIHYPQACRTPAQLQILAEDWAEDLAEFSPDVVTQAVKQYRRESAYFPTVADIWARCDELRRDLEAMARERQALPESTLTFDQRCEAGIAECAKILANLRDKADARNQARQDVPLADQLAGLRKLGVMQ